MRRVEGSFQAGCVLPSISAQDTGPHVVVTATALRPSTSRETTHDFWQAKASAAFRVNQAWPALRMDVARFSGRLNQSRSFLDAHHVNLTQERSPRNSEQINLPSSRIVQNVKGEAKCPSSRIVQNVKGEAKCPSSRIVQNVKGEAKCKYFSRRAQRIRCDSLISCSLRYTAKGCPIKRVEALSKRSVNNYEQTTNGNKHLAEQTSPNSVESFSGRSVRTTKQQVIPLCGRESTFRFSQWDRLCST